MFDVAIIGAGPAAAAALRGLGGGNIIVIDAGGAEGVRAPPIAEGQRWAEWRESDPTQWKALVGERFQALERTSSMSPKFGLPHIADVFAQSLRRSGLERENFAGPVTLARGGLSNFWGAGAAFFSEADIRNWPIAGAELAPYYKLEAEAIGVCAASDADFGVATGLPIATLPAPAMHPLAALVFERAKGLRERGVRVRTGMSAVTTVAHDGRNGCDLSGTCLIACPHSAIYNAADDLKRAFDRRRARGIPSTFVTRLERTRTGWLVIGADAGGGEVAINARMVVLAAGAIGSAAIVLRSLGGAISERPLCSTPAAGFAFWFPFQIGRAAATRFFGLGQLAVHVQLGAADDDDAGYGSLFCTEGMPSAFAIGATGFPRGAARRLMRIMLPTMLVGSFFFPSRYSSHRIALTVGNGVRVTGGMSEHLAVAQRQAERKLARLAWRSWGLLAPGGLRLSPPGGDIHYAGSLPHRCAPSLGESWPDGRLEGLDGVYVADGAALPDLPAKSHTLTLMANAHRIGVNVRGRIQEMGAA